MTDRDTLTEEGAPSEWRGILARTVLALLVLLGAYGGAAYYLGNRIPNGTTVQGVSIGHLTPAAARDTLEGRLEALRTDPVMVEVGGEALELAPAVSGLTVDLEATLEGMTEVSLDPRVLWDRITDNGSELPLRVAVDPAALRQALAEQAAAVDVPPREAEVSLSPGRVHTTEPAAGRRLDVAATAAVVERAWPEDRTVQGSVQEWPPQLPAGEIERFVAEEAEPAMSAPVTLTTGDQQAIITVNQLSRLLTVQRSQEGGLELVLDEGALLEVVRGALTEVETPPRDASVRLGDDGRAEVVPARVGTVLAEDAVINQVSAALRSPERTVEIPTTQVEPDITQQEADAWRVQEVMAEFRSEFPTGPANEARTTNIRIGLGHLNGSVVMPGEQFSLGEALSPIAPERGYVEAGVIVDGRLVEGMGGGLSQVSTTLLNTAWSAGVQIDEFTPHSYYIPRYPAGREAAISLPVIDNQWTNDTTSPVVVQAFIEGNEIVMRFWGDRQYEVRTVTGERRDIVEPERSTDDSPDCLPQSPQEGFEITVTRVLLEGGEEVDRQSYTTRYRPAQEVTCTHPEAGH